MVEYLDIDRNEQSSLIKSMKKESGLSWRRIHEELGVAGSMVYFYRSGKCRIPREKLLVLAQLSKNNLRVSDYRFVKANYALRVARMPEMNGNVAEFLGILFGDGCLGTLHYEINVSGDSVADFLYHDLRVKPLFKELFDLNAKFTFDVHNREMHTMLYSKMVHSLLSEKYSFPIGYKKGRMTIPKVIYERDEYKKAFLRGLFDTDGGVHRHHNKSIQVQITSADEVFLKEVADMIQSFGFNARINGWDIQIRGKEEIHRFFKEISPANPKHQYKYRKFVETGVVPRHREIDYALINE